MAPSDLPLTVNLVLFVGAAVVVWISGSRLIRFADILSDRFGLAKATVGLLFLATATSLPEMVTTASGAIAENAGLVLNNLFGGIALQTAMLAIADYWAKGAISNYPRRTDHLLEATLLLIMMSGLWAAMTLEEPLALWNIGGGSIVLAIVYFGCIVLLRRNSVAASWLPVDLPSNIPDPIAPIDGRTNEALSNSVLIAGTTLACLGVFVAGTGLVWFSEAIAIQSNLGSSFIGATLLALATSMPELSVTISAVRTGAYTLAISNVFGSNLIMVVLVLPADILYRPAPILAEAGNSVALALAGGMIVTAIYMVGMIVRRTPRIGRLGLDSVSVLTVYTFMIVGLRYLS